MSDINRWMHDVDRLCDNPGDWTGEAYTADTDTPTAEELAQEAAYYASLEQADADAEQAYAELVGDDDGDDMGYCGPTCGKFGDW